MLAITAASFGCKKLHYSIVEPYCSNFRVITANFSGVQTFQIFMVKKKGCSYRKNPKISDTRKFAVITLKVEQDGFSLRVMHPKDAEGIANSVDPDQNAPLGAV